MISRAPAFQRSCTFQKDFDHHELSKVCKKTVALDGRVYDRNPQTAAMHASVVSDA